MGSLCCVGIRNVIYGRCRISFFWAEHPPGGFRKRQNIRELLPEETNSTYRGNDI